jgi:hypothetical protein
LKSSFSHHISKPEDTSRVLCGVSDSYSLERVSTGLVRAALTEIKLIVIREIISVTSSEAMKGITVAITKGDNPKSIL